MTKFLLKNKNKTLAKFNVDGDKITNIIRDKDIPLWINDFEQWLENRLAMSTRKNILEIARLSKIKTLEDYLNINKAISINDCLWVDNGDYTTWDKINPYKNDIDHEIAALAINGNTSDLELSEIITDNSEIAKPNVQLKLSGEMDKGVKRINDTLYLFKTSNNKNRVYNEYFVSELCKTLGIANFVEYKIKEIEQYDGSIKAYSVCELFTDESFGLVEYADTVYNKNSVEKMMELLSKNKLQKQSYITLEEMMILDCITLNISRHQRNYGFILDNDKFKLKGIHRIYNNSTSLGSTVNVDLGYGAKVDFEKAYNLIKESSKADRRYKTFDEQAKVFVSLYWYKKLRDIGGEIKIQKNKLRGIEEERVELINYIINNRIKEIVQVVKEYHRYGF